MDPAALISIPSLSKKNSKEKIVNAAEVNQWRCLEERRKRLENVDQTHVVLASGKVVLQKKFRYIHSTITLRCNHEARR